MAPEKELEQQTLGFRVPTFTKTGELLLPPSNEDSKLVQLGLPLADRNEKRRREPPSQPAITGHAAANPDR